MLLALSFVLSVRVGTITDIGAAKSFNQTFADRVEGRYVTLSLQGSLKILTLCEVEVYGYRAPTGENRGHHINKYAKCAAILMISGKPKTKPFLYIFVIKMCLQAAFALNEL